MVVRAPIHKFNPTPRFRCRGDKPADATVELVPAARLA